MSWPDRPLMSRSGKDEAHMSDWSWVFLGYALAFGSSAVYLLNLRARLSRARRMLERP